MRQTSDAATERLFVALAVPEAARARMADLETPHEGLRWVRPAQMHLTLHFLGTVEAARRDALVAALGALRVTEFRLRLAGVGVFPSRRRPRVLWVGAEAPAGLATLHHLIGEALARLQLSPDRKPFHPHITLARFRRPDPRWARTFLRTHARFEAGAFSVTAFHLYRSTRHPGGAVYDRLAAFPLVHP